MQTPKTFRKTLLDLIAGIVVISAANAPRAQTSDTKPPAFEVASVKANKSGAQAMQRLVIVPGDRITVTNMTLRTLIQTAYGIEATQIVGGPSWIGDDRFDIIAKADAPASMNQLKWMLRTLLGDRFTLVVHTEPRKTPIYALIMANRDQKLGPNLRPATTDCKTLIATRPPDQQANPCGVMLNVNKSNVHGGTIDSLAAMLSLVAGRKVVNKTGLTVAFDWDLTWTPEAVLQSPLDRQRILPGIDPNGPSIFTALQEQLGLKLDSQQGLVDMIVIDHVEQPTPD